MDWKEKLKHIIPQERVSTQPQVLEQHGQDETYHPPHLPDAVVFPLDRDEVSRLLSFAQEHVIPVVPFGVGTSLEGHIIPQRGGMTLDMSMMNRILEIRPDDFIARVQPGVTRKQLNGALKPHGLFLPVDPGADATIGGMVSTNASGTTTVRYGVMRDQVLSLEVVLPGGSIIQTGNLARKTSAGYHLTGLFAGSEGTLGVITEIRLRLHGIPEAIMAIQATFPTPDKAVAAAVSIRKAGIPVARMELVDDVIIRAVNRYRQTGYAELPTLLLEFHGNPGGLGHDVYFAREISSDNGCQSFAAEQDEHSRQQLWEARHLAALAFMAQFPGKRQMATDVCLPPSLLPEAIHTAKELLSHFRREGAVFGHVGDGNFHVIIAIDPKNPADISQAEQFNEALVHFAISHGGTCTGEHGIGLGKRKYLSLEHGNAVEVMRAIKRALDPLEIMNPGKILPEETARQQA